MSTKARLLFVDDEVRIVNLLRAIFRSQYEVHTATSGREALAIIETQSIDVIVSDQRMPEMLGFELLSEVRKRSPATMRILLTGYADLAAIVGSVNDGEVFRFINKPWGHAEIQEIIADAVDAGRASTMAAAESLCPQAARLDNAEAPGLLLLDDSSGDRQAMVQVIGNDYNVHSASSIAEAVKILAENDIGVIVSESRIGGNDAGELLRILKQQYPSITTVMLTNSANSDMVIKLINGAQIFRFATKPIRASVFQLTVSAAMKEHRRFRANPSLVRRHRVAPSGELENKALAASVKQSLNGWRARLMRAAGLMR